MWLLIISNPSIKFDSHRSRENEFVTFISFMILCDHVINRLCGFVDNRPALEPTTWSTLVAIGLAEVEFYRFSSACDQLITCSKRQKTQSMAVLTINLYLVWQSLTSWKWRYIVFYLSRDSKCGDHKFCGSGDMIYFNI